MNKKQLDKIVYNRITKIDFRCLSYVMEVGQNSLVIMFKLNYYCLKKLKDELISLRPKKHPSALCIFTKEKTGNYSITLSCPSRQSVYVKFNPRKSSVYLTLDKTLAQHLKKRIIGKPHRDYKTEKEKERILRQQLKKEKT
ncbi:MAG TPA: hypothetical protein P5150_08190 [Candidatus Ratteibacteria bacterium]|nr:hypothetical protein [Candidatus Ratteibacteria bacterium]